MRVAHRGLDVFVTEQLLNGPDIISVLQQVRGEGMAEGVAGRMLGEPHRGGCRFDGPLEE
jgi:hypothetical protein